MKLIANRQLTGVYGTVGPGEAFECDDELAQELLRAGVVRKAEPPRVLYQTKAVSPPEVGPAIPFRDLPVPDAKPQEVAAQGDPVLPGPNLRQERAPDPVKRRGRAGPGRS
jgi:hypothetical protein